MAKVTLTNVAKVYANGFKAVKNIDLEIMDKEFMVLVGPSGCGKSTTLRMIAGLEELSEGHIEIDQRIVNNVLPKDRDIAMVFQNYALYPHMSVFENMAFGLKLRKFKKAEIIKRVDQAAEILNLTEVLQRRPKQLSGGQRQRVAVGRAIVRDPKVFLFDEPLSNLDAKMRIQMRAEISKLHSSLKNTMIYVTHDQTEAMTMGDRICVMNEGVIQQLDTPINLYDNPANLFVASFIGTPPMNFFDGKILSYDGKIFFIGDDLKILLPESYCAFLQNHDNCNVTMGLRPEFICLESDIEKQHFDKDSFFITDANVEVIEPMGSETFIYFKKNRYNFIGKVNLHNSIELNSNIKIAFNLKKLHFFDNESTISIITDK